jgi:hypothetical protein
MQTIDFSRSFLTFRNDWLKKPPETVSHKPPFTLNNARILLECVCAITDKTTGDSTTYILGASCKTERVGVKKDIWLDPNADFSPVFSADRFLIIKTYDRADKVVPFYPPSRGMQPERQAGNVADAFDQVKIDIHCCPGEVLEDPAQIVAAVLDNHPIVARTILQSERYTATLNYPGKTINANERDHIYQTDTGPILLPDFSRQPEDLISGFELAYSAFNCPDWIELIIREPTPVSDEINVYHYNRPLHLKAENQIIRLI